MTLRTLPSFTRTVDDEPLQETVSLVDLANSSRLYNGFEPNTLILGSNAARVLFGEADYAALEARALVVFASGDVHWPRSPQGNLEMTCTRLLERTPEWVDFQNYVESYRGSYAEWRNTHTRFGDKWAQLVTSIRVVKHDPPGTRKRWTPPPHQTTGQEALYLWKATAGHFG